tara:strand:+ start:832 stop:2247 length:1416 start_codon:yes stop_codon:yes gene_type:complete
MKKALIIVALFLVPFLSVKADIFTDGTVDLKPAKLELAWTATCGANELTIEISGIGSLPNDSVIRDTCGPDLASLIEANFTDFNCRRDGLECTSIYETGSISEKRIYNGTVFFSKSHVVSVLIKEETIARTCPPDAFPSYVANYFATDGEVYCFNPDDANLNDSCSVSNGNEYLTIEVSAPSGCFPQPDGSMCKYDAVDIGGGNEYYALDLEGDCYSDNDLPTLNGIPQDMPTGEECVSFGGGVLGCPEDPSNVCTGGGVYAGGSVQNCQSGCGMVNDQFLCIDNDLDGDGLPDYNDPDIDGDGIPNDDDLDNDNDGKDDPIHGDKPGTNIPGSGVGSGGEIKIDLTPVVNELKKLNESFSDGGQAKDLDHNQDLTNLNDAYQTKLTSLMGKTSSELGYTDSLNLGNSSGLSSRLPTNDCTVYNFHPAGKTISLDMCFVADKVKPLLFWLFGLLTAWHIFYTINKTLREGI